MAINKLPGPRKPVDDLLRVLDYTFHTSSTSTTHTNGRPLLASPNPALVHTSPHTHKTRLACTVLFEDPIRKRYTSSIAREILTARNNQPSCSTIRLSRHYKRGDSRHNILHTIWRPFTPHHLTTCLHTSNRTRKHKTRHTPRAIPLYPTRAKTGPNMLNKKKRSMIRQVRVPCTNAVNPNKLKRPHPPGSQQDFVNNPKHTRHQQRHANIYMRLSLPKLSRLTAAGALEEQADRDASTQKKKENSRKNNKRYLSRWQRFLLWCATMQHP